MADINFYPTPIAQAYERDPRRELAMALMQQGRSPEAVRTPIQGWSNVIQGILGKYQQDKLQGEYGQRSDRYRANQMELAKALMGSDPQSAALLQAMGNNPDTADVALPFAIQGYGARQKAAADLAAERAKVREIAPGGSVYDPTLNEGKGGLAFTAGPAPITPYQQAQLDQGAAQFGNTLATAAEVARHNKAMEDIAGTRASQAGNALTESEGKAVTYGQRAVESNAILTKLEGGGYQAGNSRDRAASHLPIFGTAATSQVGQQYNQAKLNFISAILRRDSGATITPQEIATADATYFPQYGEGPAVIIQKATARQQAIDALRAGSGKGAKMIPGMVNGHAVSVGDMPGGEVADSIIHWDDLEHGR